MEAAKKINQTVVRWTGDDITLLEVDAFVFYVRPDLKLGPGLGNAIAVRGGPGIQEELDKFGGAEVGEAVVTSAGKLKAKNIIHAVGPAFNEDDTEAKLRKTMQSVLVKAKESGVERLALPPMGSGFYGVAPALSVKVSLEEVKKQITGESQLKEVLFCLPDTRDSGPFLSSLKVL